MKNATPIVAAVDFSSSSRQVLEHAARLAAATGGELIAAHVVTPGEIRDWEAAMESQYPTAGREDEMIQRLGELLAGSCPGVTASIEVGVGTPHKVLAEILRGHGAGLLVLGAHDVSRKRLGSVAAHCARTAPADVLLLRDWQGRFFQKIAACVDFSDSSSAGLERAITVAKAHQASLEIIHVVFPPSRDPWGRVMDQPMDREGSYEGAVRENARRRMDAFLEPYGDHLRDIAHQVLFLEAESPAAAITAHVAAELIDLTVTGSRESSWVADFVLGSNAERLLHDSSSSVLVVRG
jgi:universal stress protein E